MSAPVSIECEVCATAQSVTVCDRCSRPICYACEASAGTAAQMLCIECRDQMAANANAVAQWGRPSTKTPVASQPSTKTPGGRDREPWQRIGKHMIATAKAKDGGWYVITKQGDRLGIIEWHDERRQYEFVPSAMTAYTHDCLTALGQFVAEQTAKRKGASR